MDLSSTHTVLFRQATAADVAIIVRLLADDELGSQRESYTVPLANSYLSAFEAIDQDPNNELIVATLNGEVAAVLQLTFIPYLTHQGSWRAQVEGVRVDAQYRSMRLGSQLFEWVIQRATERGCHILQLTSNKVRRDAVQFYESLGFVATHEGLKMQLPLCSNRE